MKKIMTIILLSILGFLMITGFINATMFSNYGNVKIEERVSNSFINKDVTGASEEIIFGESKNLETGSANLVTSIIVNYRSLDTLGEVTVLFISALGVSLLINSKNSKQKLRKPNFILTFGSRIIFGFILITGIYMITHGHLTPGGGFPGGSMIASAVLLMYLGDNHFKTNVKKLKMTESIAGSLYIIVGLLGIVFSGYFLNNFIPTGTLGNIFSSGVIPIVYVLIGLKVGSEISGIISNFITEEVQL